MAFMSGLEMKAVITALHHRDQSASWVYIYRVDTSTLSLWAIQIQRASQPREAHFHDLDVTLDCSAQDVPSGSFIDDAIPV